jgi:hypothetical protein
VAECLHLLHLGQSLPTQRVQPAELDASHALARRVGPEQSRADRAARAGRTL